MSRQVGIRCLANGGPIKAGCSIALEQMMLAASYIERHEEFKHRVVWLAEFNGSGSSLGLMTESVCCSVVISLSRQKLNTQRTPNTPWSRDGHLM